MRIVAFVPAKGQSDRIENKNTVILDGEHLFKRKLKQFLECDLIDSVYLDTESETLIDLASDLDVEVLKRDPNLASNTTDGHALFANECSQVKADVYIQSLCS
jgi:CMP-N-acetylneuraminic acid synthetase